MPIRQELDPTTRRFRTVISGKVCADQLRKHFMIMGQVHGFQHPSVITITADAEATFAALVAGWVTSPVPVPTRRASGSGPPA